MGRWIRVCRGRMGSGVTVGVARSARPLDAPPIELTPGPVRPSQDMRVDGYVLTWPSDLDKVLLQDLV